MGVNVGKGVFVGGAVVGVSDGAGVAVAAGLAPEQAASIGKTASKAPMPARRRFTHRS